MPKGMGLLRDLHDSRDMQFKNVERHLKLTSLVTKIPKCTDLRSMMSPIRDQGQLGACTAFAVSVGLMESVQVEVFGELEMPLSPLFLYYNTRLRTNDIDSDSGASMRDAIKAAAQRGVCSEDEWPYDVNKFTVEPSDIAFDNANRTYMTGYYRVNSADEVKKSLAFKNPVVVGLMLYSSFFTDAVTATGKVPMPNVRNETVSGGHAVCVVGYDDDQQHWVVRNSWGESWGDKGYFYLPYDYLNDRNLSVDMWTCTFTK